MSSVKIENFKPHVKNTLFGFVDVRLPSGLIICGVTLHRKNGARWCGMPAREYQQDDGTKAWLPVVKFASRQIADRFRNEVLAACDEIAQENKP